MELLYQTQGSALLHGLSMTALPVRFCLKVFAEPLEKNPAGSASDALHFEAKMTNANGDGIVGLDPNRRFSLQLNNAAFLEIRTTDPDGGFALVGSMSRCADQGAA